jgi:hypothetical protein
MTTTVPPEFLAAPAGDPARFGGRWRLVSAGLLNVWRYGSLILPAQSGRLLLRGPNGTGKTTALEALWPFLLDLDKTKLRAGQSRTTTLTSLMREGHQEKKRIGYVWLTFCGPGDEGNHSYGARLVFSNGSTPSVKVEPFTIPGEPLTDMALTGPGRSTITTADAFREVVEAAGGTVFNDEDEYLTALGNHVFSAARGDLLTLADRVRRVRNPSLLAATSADQAAQALREALPGVSSDVIEATGDALAATDETRAAFQRDVEAAATLGTFSQVWSAHAADVAGRVASRAASTRKDLTDAQNEALRRQQVHRDAVEDRQTAAADLKVALDDQDSADAEVEAIEKSPAYATIGRLADLRAAADAKDGEAEAKIDALARGVRTLNRDGGLVATEARQAAEAVAATCSTAADADPLAGATAPVVAVTTRPHATLTVGDQGFDPGVGLDLATDPDELHAAVLAWKGLANRHENRANQAHLMLKEHRTVVTAAEHDATQKSQLAERADVRADEAAHDRDRKTDRAKEATLRLGAAITTWAANNADLTATETADPLDAPAVAEAAAEGPAAFLAAASEWADSAHRSAAIIAADLNVTAGSHEQQAATIRLDSEDARRRAGELRAGRVLRPPRPDWAEPAGDDEFANAIQWSDAVDAPTRALVESALAASGVLGATLTPDGAQAGSWAVTDATPPVTSHLGTLIDADPQHPLAAVAQRVLERIALASTAASAPAEATAAVGTDGTFRFGIISGRAPGVDNPAALPAPSHIGAAQRRAAALAEAARLEAEADRLDTAAAALDSAARDLLNEARVATSRAATFPTRAALSKAEHERADAARWATERRRDADEAAETATQARQHARTAADEWRTKVTAIGLPADPDELTVASQSAAEAARALRNAAMSLSQHQSTLLKLRTRVAGHTEDRASLVGVHAAAVIAHSAARQARLAYDRLQAEHGKDAAELSERLSLAQTHAAAARELVASGRVLDEQAVEAAAKAGSDASHAEAIAADKRPAANLALAALRGLINVEDVAEAVLRGETPADGDTLVEQVAAAVTGKATSSKKRVADTYEAARAQLAGVWAVDRTDGYEDTLDTYQCTYDGTVLTPSRAAELARNLADRANERLHDAEETALRDFIVGRLPAAIGAAWQEQHDWVNSVNQKMESASASSGVGVRVRTALRDDLTITQRTVHRLACRKSAATRTHDEDNELADALKGLLAAAGGETVSDRVREAVDIRDWVRVDYLVHRPGQEPKRWTPRTGLSGGERRLVILAPMLASIAALYDSLPANALRLAALDEVPAEVDEQGREGLARYIAELDLDVICTSYLWDGAPGAWDGVDAHDLEAVDGVVVAFPMLVRGIEPLPGDPDVEA